MTLGLSFYITGVSLLRAFSICTLALFRMRHALKVSSDKRVPIEIICVTYMGVTYTIHSTDMKIAFISLEYF